MEDPSGLPHEFYFPNLSPFTTMSDRSTRKSTPTSHSSSSNYNHRARRQAVPPVAFFDHSISAPKTPSRPSFHSPTPHNPASFSSSRTRFVDNSNDALVDLLQSTPCTPQQPPKRRTVIRSTRVELADLENDSASGSHFLQMEPPSIAQSPAKPSPGFTPVKFFVPSHTSATQNSAHVNKPILTPILRQTAILHRDSPAGSTAKSTLPVFAPLDPVTPITRKRQRLDDSPSVAATPSRLQNSFAFLPTPQFQFKSRPDHAPKTTHPETPQRIALTPQSSKSSQSLFSTNAKVLGTVASSRPSTPPPKKSFWSPSPKKGWSYYVPSGLSDFIHSAISDVEYQVDVKYNRDGLFGDAFTNDDNADREETEKERQARCDQEVVDALRAEGCYDYIPQVMRKRGHIPGDTREGNKNVFAIKKSIQMNRFCWKVHFQEQTGADNAGEKPVLLMDSRNLAHEKKMTTPGTRIRLSNKEYYDLEGLRVYILWQIVT